MAKPYTAPEWAAMPIHDFSLEVLKEGVIIDSIDLSMDYMKKKDRSYVIFGRQPDIVDIQLDHASLSRQHAIIQFREDGAMMLRDFHSGLGTYLNKKKIDPDNYHRVYVGDMIKFGESTRLYVVCGPESESLPEYDSENMRKYRENLKKRDEQIKQKLVERENVGISWGFGEDATEDDDEEEEDDQRSKMPSYLRNDEHYDRKYGDSYRVDIVGNEVPENMRKTYDKIKKLETKIQNIQQENKRIYLKENTQGGEFTEGQQTAIDRNDTRIKELIEEVDELVHQIRGTVAIKKPTTNTNKRQRDLESEDTVYDTTSQTADSESNWRLRKKLANKTGSDSSRFESLTSNTPGEALSYDDLMKKKEHNDSILNTLESKINSLNAEKEELEKTLMTLDDSIDQVLCRSTIQDVDKELNRYYKEKNDLSTVQRDIIKLIEITQPALPSLVQR